jgi:hypothetical protein
VEEGLVKVGVRLSGRTTKTSQAPETSEVNNLITLGWRGKSGITIELRIYRAIGDISRHQVEIVIQGHVTIKPIKYHMV